MKIGEKVRREFESEPGGAIPRRVWQAIQDEYTDEQIDFDAQDDGAADEDVLEDFRVFAAGRLEYYRMGRESADAHSIDSKNKPSGRRGWHKPSVKMVYRRLIEFVSRNADDALLPVLWDEPRRVPGAVWDSLRLKWNTENPRRQMGTRAAMREQLRRALKKVTIEERIRILEEAVELNKGRIARIRINDAALKCVNAIVDARMQEVSRRIRELEQETVFGAAAKMLTRTEVSVSDSHPADGCVSPQVRKSIKARAPRIVEAYAAYDEAKTRQIELYREQLRSLEEIRGFLLSYVCAASEPP